MQSYVDFLLEFVQCLGLEHVSIFGNSIGGTLALLCALKSPRQFERLAVRCPLWTSRQLPGYMQFKPLVSLHHILSANRGYARWAMNLFYTISARKSPIAGKTLANPLPFRDGQVDPLVLSRFLGHLVKVEFDEALPSIPNETLVLWGALDTFIRSEWGGYLSQRLPRARSVGMDGEYHNIATADPHILAAQIAGFVSR